MNARRLMFAHASDEGIVAAQSRALEGPLRYCNGFNDEL
jgi:hypothetical protein